MAKPIQMNKMLSKVISEMVKESAENALDESGRCWQGYEPVEGKMPYEKGSCRKIPVSEIKVDDHSVALPIVKKSLGSK